ncbi:hypothetical protein FCIRC_13033 [Fusarium circinatum]|uniref:Uncharacterized protein n=1 Tax=Fusarium circinatum TaxID=48490 RepID=A0A8H5WGW2_FUSCI|nr:hypothetical protein FCIRC_13033 [Fusarium circinatum]
MAAPTQFFSLNFNGADPAAPLTCPHCNYENPANSSMCEGYERGKPCCCVVPIIFQAQGGAQNGDGNDDDGTSDEYGGES